MYMLVSIASALVSVYACMLGCMYVCELGGSFAGGCPSLALGYGPFPVTVTTRIIPFLVGNPYKPLFATVTGNGRFI